MKTAKQFLKSKKLKDTLYNVETDDGSWVKGGLSKLLDEYADSKVKNFSSNLPVIGCLPPCPQCGQQYGGKKPFCLDDECPLRKAAN